ncbi:peptide ABC transporter permease [Vulcanimicrobium alpinum]|uniref:Peptide ABC transporter permease n=1 Tax=Vulcanimicrobium alpinum TaxID=3016050 RepID=A0AAN1XU18_UNVUL|nr:ABC transporter permease [Vulcanimicrobium alpinum]BDE05125.1 peptide ABC transporter permease [Vulcanimicrobium alpinum]
MSGLLRRFVREPPAVAAALVLIVIVAAALLGPVVWQPSPSAVNHAVLGLPQPPSAAHPFGTDVLGRDQLARALQGARISLTVGVTAMLVSMLLGSLYGAIAGLAGGRVDALMMRFVDAMLSFPTFFLIITVEALTNRFSVALIVLIIGLLSWMGVARLVRAEVLTLRERDFVEAARALGAGPVRLIARHLLPNALAPIAVAAALAIGDNILIEAGLSYLGLGVQVPTASWGNMLQDALGEAGLNAPWLIVAPGALIVVTLLAFNLLGEGIRVAFDRSIAQE